MERLDLYCGGFAGFRIFNWNNANFIGKPTSNAYGNAPIISAHVGARYYFTPIVGAFAEVAVGGWLSANTGLALRF